MVNPVEYVKEHPVTSTVVGGAAAIALFLLVKGSGGGGQAVVQTGPSPDEIQAATQLQTAQMQLAQQNQAIQGQISLVQTQGSIDLQMADLQSKYALQSTAAQIAGQIELAQLTQQVDLTQISAQQITAQKSIEAETQREANFYNAGIQQSQINATLQTNLANISATSAVQQAAINADMQARLSELQASASNTQAKQSSKSSIWGTIGSVATAALAIFSDSRLKTDIRRIGTRADGIGIYSFRYAGDDQTYTGVLAEDVARVRPDAVYQDTDGFLMVDYNALGAELVPLRRAA
jgi:multidrug efflux pump subunit AcrA (membrane-fusion protein)